MLRDPIYSLPIEKFEILLECILIVQTLAVVQNGYYVKS